MGAVVYVCVPPSHSTRERARVRNIVYSLCRRPGGFYNKRRLSKKANIPRPTCILLHLATSSYAAILLTPLTTVRLGVLSTGALIMMLNTTCE